LERKVTLSGLLDRSALNREIEAILLEAPGNLPAAAIIEDHIVNLVRDARRDDVSRSAQHVIAVLSLDLDSLRKAALLSLMVRLTGKGKFDPVAVYVLEKRSTYVTSPG
jgi:hypothetical protein